jgi:ABC-type microcin C transport system permease subunit YejE
MNAKKTTWIAVAFVVIACAALAVFKLGHDRPVSSVYHNPVFEPVLADHPR